MANKKFNSVAGFSVGNTSVVSVIDSNANIYANSLSVEGNVTISSPDLNLGPVENVHITGGQAGQVLTTDGAGNLSWSSASGGNGTSITNGNSNVAIPESNGNVTVSVGGNANVLVVSPTGANVEGNVTATYFVGNGAFLTGIEGGNVTSLSNGTSNVNIPYENGNVYLSADGTANVLEVNAAGVNISGRSNISGNLNIGGNSSVTGNLSSNGAISANGNVSGANITTAGQIVSTISQGIAPIVISSATRVANLNAELVEGYSPNSSVVANTIAVRDANGNIAANYFIGDGSQLTGIIASGSNIINGNSTVDIPTLNGNVELIAGGNTTLVVTPTGANVTGTINSTGNATFANVSATEASFVTIGGILTTSSQPNLTSIGTLSSLSVTGAIVAGNVFANSGTVRASNLTGTLTTAAQPNITSVGTLSSLAVSGNISSGNVDGGNLVKANNFQGNIVTAAQPNITSLGTLTSLGVSGNITAANITANTGIFSGNAAGLYNIPAANITGSLANATHAITANTVSDAAQPNITSLGNLVSLTVDGNVDVGGNVNTDRISSKSGNITITATGSDGHILLTPSGTGTIDAGNARISNVGYPSTSTDAASKSYVDNMVAAGIEIHPAVNTDSDADLPGTYAQGGTTPTWTTITNNRQLATATAHNLSINDSIVFGSSTNGLTAGVPYFVYSVPTSTTITLSASYGGSQLTTLTNGTGLTITSRANAGVGATLTGLTNENLVVENWVTSVNDRILLANQDDATENGVYVVTDTGEDGVRPWILTRASDADTYKPSNVNGLDQGAYFLVTGGDDMGESYVCNTPGAIVFGITEITFAVFSIASTYSAGTGLTLAGNGQFSISNTAVTAGSYGNGESVPTFTVNDQGQLTAASTTAITANANLLVGTQLNSNIVTSNLTTVGTLSNLTVSGNANIGNIGSGGAIVATGNVSGGNITTAGALSVTGNANVGNIGAAQVLASANVTAPQFISNVATGTAPLTVQSSTKVANLNADLLDGYNTATANTANTVAVRDNNGNIAANFFIGNGSQLTGVIAGIGDTIANGNSNITIFSTSVGISANATANVLTVQKTGANVNGTLTTTGNVTAPFFIGNGSQLTGVIAGIGDTIANGNSNITIFSTSVGISANATANVVQVFKTAANVNGNLNVSGNIVATNITGRFANGTSNINIPASAGNITFSVGGTANSVVVTSTGIVSSNFVGPLSNGVSNVNIPESSGNITLSVAGSSNVVVVTSSGANVDGSLTATGNITAGSGSGGTIQGANLVSATNLTAISNVNSSNTIASSYFIASVANNVSANGSTQSTATLINKQLNLVATVSSGQGVVLPTAVPGMIITIINSSANTLSVYPATGAAIDAIAANSAYSQTANARVDFCAITSTQWYTK